MMAKRYDEGYFCSFPIEPSFTVRGLCEDALMDTQFKFGALTPSENSLGFTGGRCNVCMADYRSFIGPKGWILLLTMENEGHGR